jgi:hydroxymethylpyrimidine/phosphomethylpyrimidine kinase
MTMKPSENVKIPRGRVLSIAGSDSSGGAGIQADLKTILALQGYGATAITALTAQNTMGVEAISEVPEAFIAQQIRAVISDIGMDAIKTGMLHKRTVIRIVADTLLEIASTIPLIMDPVMVAKGGHPLLEAEAVSALKVQLVPMATLVTPNIPEAEILTGIKILSTSDMKKAAEAICKMGAQAALVKGGHMTDETVHDILFDGRQFHSFESARIHSQHTHGTGCTLASAIATCIAKGEDMLSSVSNARRYVFEAIRTAPGFGHGHGPLNHGHTVCLVN